MRERPTQASAQTLPADWLASLIRLVGSDRSARIVAELGARLEREASKNTQE